MRARNVLDVWRRSMFILRGGPLLYRDRLNPLHSLCGGNVSRDNRRCCWLHGVFRRSVITSNRFRKLFQLHTRKVYICNWRNKLRKLRGGHVHFNNGRCKLRKLYLVFGGLGISRDCVCGVHRMYCGKI
jgi:hypothetical protein